MMLSVRKMAFSAAALSVLGVVVYGDVSQLPREPGCVAAVDRFFADEVWGKVGSQSCLQCHKAGGDAADSQLVLLDPQRAGQNVALRQNREVFLRMARVKEGEQSRLLLKASGGLEHGGEAVLKADSTGYRILSEFVRRANLPPGQPTQIAADDKPAKPFFDGVAMLDDRRLLRRATLSLAGRLPTKPELEAVAGQGLTALPSILDTVMQEEAFYDRLREGFNDIFLTVGYDDGAESALTYTHFEKTRHWTQNHDLSHIADENARQKARYKLAPR